MIINFLLLIFKYGSGILLAVGRNVREVRKAKGSKCRELCKNAGAVENCSLQKRTTVSARSVPKQWRWDGCKERQGFFPAPPADKPTELVKVPSRLEPLR